MTLLRSMTPTVRRTRLALPLIALALAAAPAGAATWSAPQSLSAPGAPAADPRVGVDGAGGAVAVWLSGSGTVKAAARPPRANRWERQTTLWSSEARVEQVYLAVGARGHAVAAWVRHDGVSGSVTMAAIRNRDGRWLPVQEVGLTASSGIDDLAVAVDDAGRAVVAWYGPRGGDGVRLMAARRPSGGRFGAPAVVSARPAVDADVHLALDVTGGTTAIWTQESGTEARVVSATAGPGSTDWSAPVAISARAPLELQEAFGIGPAGRLLATWKVFTGPRRGLSAAVRRPDGRWERPRRVARLDHGRVLAGGFDGALRPFVIWGDARDTYRSVRGAKGWLGARRTPVGAVAEPAFATRRSGELLALWQLLDSERHVAPVTSERGADGWTSPHVLAGPVANPRIPCAVNSPCLPIIRHLPRQHALAVGPSGAAAAVWTMPSGDHMELHAAWSNAPSR